MAFTQSDAHAINIDENGIKNEAPKNTVTALIKSPGQNHVIAQEIDLDEIIGVDVDMNGKHDPYNRNPNLEDTTHRHISRKLATSLHPKIESSKKVRSLRRFLYGQGPAEDHSRKAIILKVELRRFFAELYGTFLLVFFHAGINAASVWLRNRGQNVVAPSEFGLCYGFTLLALIFMLGSVSGAHLNPVVTLAFALRGVFKWWRLPFYILFQLAGAIIGAGFVRAIFGDRGYAGANLLPAYSTDFTAFGTEIIGTLFFISVVLATSRASKITGATAALAVGTCYGGIAVLSSFVGTISLNPSRSLGPAIVAGGGPQWNIIWIYITGPIIGCIIAVFIDRLIISQRGIDYQKSIRKVKTETGKKEPAKTNLISNAAQECCYVGTM